MSFIKDLRDAVLGWLDLLAGRKDAGARFNPTREGLTHALVFYFLVIVGIMAIEGFTLGQLPDFSRFSLGLAVNGLPLAGMAIAIVATRAILQLPVPFLSLFVPASYALAFVTLIGLPLALIAGNLFSNAMLGITGFMLYRLGREVGGMKVSIAIAFAAVSVVALAVVPVGLYMLIVPAPPAA